MAIIFEGFIDDVIVVVVAVVASSIGGGIGGLSDFFGYGGGGGGNLFAFGIRSNEFRMLSSDLDRANIDGVVVIGLGRNGTGGGASYEEQRLAIDGLYRGEYAPDGNCTYVSDKFCVDA